MHGTVMRRLPSLNSLKAFEASARHCSFTEAADELSVTQTAISRHIKGLEDYLGVQLFHRHPRRVELTEHGTMLLPALTDIFDRLARITAEVQQGAHELALKVPPTFASRWLIKNIGDFYEEWPEIDVRFSPTWQPVNFAKETYDAGIVCSAKMSGYDSSVDRELIFSEIFTPVCSSELLKSGPSVNGPEDLLNFTLLHSTTDIDYWSLWFEGNGIEYTANDAAHNRSFELLDSAVQAAVEGMGLALADPRLISDEISLGRLVTPFEDLKLELGGYYFVCPKTLSTQTRITVFRNWLARTVQE